MDKEHMGDNPILAHKFTDDDIAATVSDEMPQWKKACDSSEADQVIFHPDAYGYTVKELLLMAFAIKYATVCKGKGIMIAPKK
jgi:hypothetical protein